MQKFIKDLVQHRKFATILAVVLIYSICSSGNSVIARDVSDGQKVVTIASTVSETAEATSSKMIDFMSETKNVSGARRNKERLSESETVPVTQSSTSTTTEEIQKPEEEEVLESSVEEAKEEFVMEEVELITFSESLREEPEENDETSYTGKDNPVDGCCNNGEFWGEISIIEPTGVVIPRYPQELWPNTWIYHYGEVLTPGFGTVIGPSGKETYYNLPMEGVIRYMKDLGYDYEYWIRDDGVKMYGDYVMVAANLSIRPKGTLVDTTLGKGIVCDTGSFADWNPYQLDIAVNW